MEQASRSVLNSYNHIVVKVGTSSLAYDSGKLNLACIENLVRQMADLHNQGRKVILVTSGAIGAGAGKIGLKSRPRTIPEKQACAAVGQGMLLHMYEKIFSEYGITVGQVLLTREDFADRRRFLNARNTLRALLRFGVLPIINENDTVAVDEIKLGDNDNLSALVAGLIDFELLVMLTDTDGLYTANPRLDPEARLLSSVDEITPDIEQLAGAAGSRLGTGGMVSKLHAVRVATHSGITAVIARATEDNVLRRVLSGEEIGTVFWPVTTKMENRKQWIAYSTTVRGRIVVDEGAARALLENGKSLLPSGVVGVDGVFEMGSTVSIVNPEGHELARGLTNFSSEEVERIKGCKTGQITKILGCKRNEEIVHRNNMVLEL
ncbi:MAG: glutamate 5-kinase [Eubacteriales bacterium]|jgi:glutamate 5-kinase|nr:glutamate 5-kinase [Bacillota bacterium]MBV1727672.1 glutamate 5-kinase [Desulforudis sp.]MDZ4041988.1 glutamate 5-kinase [Eubacteriales bacterium]MBU4532734.1 glutamate 5-kinase [Bacillota bacterium]MBU4554375.1 glutamate 5-kinase [Bacillota bacterium]